jgi:hypothetical protein
MDLTAKAKSSWSLIKNNWGTFLVVAIIVAGVVLYYDLKNNGELTKKFSDAPIIGDKFKKAAPGAGASA